MKSSEFKQLIKESVREVFREEIKEILLEAVRTPKAVVQESTYRPENYNPNYPKINDQSSPIITSVPSKGKKQDLREQYMNILGETGMSFNTSNTPFSPIGADPINGELPAGEVSLGQISNLLNNK